MIHGLEFAVSSVRCLKELREPESQRFPWKQQLPGKALNARYLKTIIPAPSCPPGGFGAPGTQGPCPSVGMGGLQSPSPTAGLGLPGVVLPFVAAQQGPEGALKQLEVL